jgi:hypothetical protein
MQLQQEMTPITLDAPPEVITTAASGIEQAAIKHFWQFRIQMNPRLVLAGKWFPRALARQLRKFWDDFKAGKRPVMLLMTPPQHGKSLSVIDFIAWAVGHDPELRVIFHHVRGAHYLAIGSSAAPLPQPRPPAVRGRCGSIGGSVSAVWSFALC